MNSRTTLPAAGFTTGAGAALAAIVPSFRAWPWQRRKPLRARPIPHSGEPLPIIGIGTAVIFDFENDPVKHAERRQVIRRWSRAAAG